MSDDLGVAHDLSVDEAKANGATISNKTIPDISQSDRNQRQQQSFNEFLPDFYN